MDAQFCTTNRAVLDKIGDELNFWGRTWRRRHGTPVMPAVIDNGTDEDAYEEEVEDEYDDASNDVTENDEMAAR
ncbi:MAG TPA: hypothetical protein VH418_21485 [Solirubrobacteraceae bacterium]